jgi:hypothetical protein
VSPCLAEAGDTRIRFAKKQTSLFSCRRNCKRYYCEYEIVVASKAGESRASHIRQRTRISLESCIVRPTAFVGRDIGSSHCAIRCDGEPVRADFGQSQSTDSCVRDDGAVGGQTAETLPRLRAGLCADPGQQCLRQDRRLGAGAGQLTLTLRFSTEGLVQRSGKWGSFRGHALGALNLRVELRRLVAVGHAVIPNDADPSVA